MRATFQPLGAKYGANTEEPKGKAKGDGSWARTKADAAAAGCAAGQVTGAGTCDPVPECGSRSRGPEVLPADQRIVDELSSHMGDIDHHVHLKRTIDLESARRIFKVRNEFNLLLGFQNLRDLVVIDRDLLDILVSACSAGTYGRWDYLYEMEAGGVELSIEHAALLRTGEVIFLESGTDTIVWDPGDEVTPQFTNVAGVVTGLTADLFCSGHVILSDGKLLVVGGGGGGPGAATSNQGWKFDPIART